MVHIWFFFRIFFFFLSDDQTNNSSKQKRINTQKNDSRSDDRYHAYQEKRLQIIQQLRLHFGLPSDTKIILADDDKEINLSFGKIAIFNSSGTELICSVEFHHLSSTSGPAHHSFQSLSSQTFQSITFGTLDHTDPATLSQHIDSLDTYLSSVRLNPHLLSSNLSECFSILYQHALSRYEVKSNSAMKRMGSQAQGKMFAIGYRSEAMVGKHQEHNKYIGNFFFLCYFFDLHLDFNFHSRSLLAEHQGFPKSITSSTRSRTFWNFGLHW